MPLGVGGDPTGSFVGGNNYWWQPGQFTGPGGYDWSNTPYGTTAMEKNAQSAWLQYGSRLGIGGTDNRFDDWFRRQFGDMWTGFGAASISNPLIRLPQYLNQLGGSDAWRRRYEMTTTPQSRGEQNATYAPVARWQHR